MNSSDRGRAVSTRRAHSVLSFETASGFYLLAGGLGLQKAGSWLAVASST